MKNKVIRRNILKALGGNSRAAKILAKDRIAIPCKICGSDMIRFGINTSGVYEIRCQACHERIVSNTGYVYNKYHIVSRDRLEHYVLLLRWNTRLSYWDELILFYNYFRKYTMQLFEYTPYTIQHDNEN